MVEKVEGGNAGAILSYGIALFLSVIWMRRSASSAYLKAEIMDNYGEI